LVPSCLFMLLAVIATIALFNMPETPASTTPPKPTESILEVETKAGLTSSDLVHQLEIQTLKRQLEAAKEKLRENKHLLDTNIEAHRAERFKQELASVLTQNKEYQLKIGDLEKELEKSKNLLEKLLDERLEKNRKSRDEEPDEEPDENE